MSEIFLLWVIIGLSISLLYLLPVETHIRGWMLNCCAVVMFTMLMLSTSCGFAQYRLSDTSGGLFESSKSFMVHRSALLLVSWSIFWQVFLVLEIVLIFTFPVLTFDTKQLLIVSTSENSFSSKVSFKPRQEFIQCLKTLCVQMCLEDCFGFSLDSLCCVMSITSEKNVNSSLN